MLMKQPVLLSTRPANATSPSKRRMPSLPCPARVGQSAPRPWPAGIAGLSPDRRPPAELPAPSCDHRKGIVTRPLAHSPIVGLEEFIGRTGRKLENEFAGGTGGAQEKARPPPEDGPWVTRASRQESLRPRPPPL